VLQPVVHPVCDAAICHKTSILQIAQVPGNIRLCCVEDELNVAPAQLSVEEEIEDAKTFLVCQPFEV
jgi:hypothetical protein